jgi:hypothetical protein
VRDHDLHRDIICPASPEVLDCEICRDRAERQRIAAPRGDVIRGANAANRSAGRNQLQGDGQRQGGEPYGVMRYSPLCVAALASRKRGQLPNVLMGIEPASSLISEDRSVAFMCLRGNQL